MVAIATLPRTVTSPTTAPSRVRRPAPHGPARAHGPALALVPPVARGTSWTPGRLVGGAVLALAVLLAGGYLVRTPDAAPAAVPTTHVVAEGETMWSIAVASAPAGEAAGYVERLVAANGSVTVAPGQTVTLPRP